MIRWALFGVITIACLAGAACVKVTHARFSDAQALIWSSLVLAYVLTFLMSGYSPFYWLGKFCVKAEAHQQHLLKIAGEAATEYKARYRDTEAEVKRAAQKI